LARKTHHSSDGRLRLGSANLEALPATDSTVVRESSDLLAAGRVEVNAPALVELSVTVQQNPASGART
jgi:hypothetical protein